MSDQPLSLGADNQNDEDNASELDMLKARASAMGIPFSNNIGVETLRQRITEKMEGIEQPTTPAEPLEAPVTFAPPPSDPAPVYDTQASAPTPASAPAEPVVQKTLRQLMAETQMKLVRLRIQNLDPKKKDLHGEVLTVANEYLGIVKKFVPYGEVTEGGYHVPWCIYEVLRSRKFVHITSRTDRITGRITVTEKWVPEFSLEVLPQLTREELAQLATAQLQAGG